MCRPGLACANCAGWSGSIHYSESIMLVSSWNGSYITYMRLFETVVNVCRFWWDGVYVQADLNLRCSEMLLCIFSPMNGWDSKIDSLHVGHALIVFNLIWNIFIKCHKPRINPNKSSINKTAMYSDKYSRALVTQTIAIGYVIQGLWIRTPARPKSFPTFARSQCHKRHLSSTNNRLKVYVQSKQVSRRTGVGKARQQWLNNYWNIIKTQSKQSIEFWKHFLDTVNHW